MLMLRSGGRDAVLVVSASSTYDGDPGGLLTWDGETLRQVDSVASTGLATDGRTLVRALYTSSDPLLSLGELLVYDREGALRYLRVDELADAHEIWLGPPWLLAVSAFRNAIVWVTPSGEIADRWTAPGEPDSWHLNGVALRDGTLYATAFGRYARFREWNDHKRSGHGILFDVREGRDIVTGLSCPHSPRWIDGAWLVCSSADGEVWRVDDGGRIDKLQLGGWTRGVAVGDDHIIVGVSAPRHQSTGDNGRFVVLDRRTLRSIVAIELPVREVSELALVDPEMVRGLERGFASGSARADDGERFRLFNEVGLRPAAKVEVAHPLPADACRARVTCDLPSSLGAGQLASAQCSVRNEGSAVLVSALPNPVRIAWRWTGAGQDSSWCDDGSRAALPRAIAPGQTVSRPLLIRVPAEPGRYDFTITLVQEHVHRFDHLDAGSGSRVSVDVVPEERSVP